MRLRNGNARHCRVVWNGLQGFSVCFGCPELLRRFGVHQPQTEGAVRMERLSVIGTAIMNQRMPDPAEGEQHQRRQQDTIVKSDSF